MWENAFNDVVVTPQICPFDVTASGHQTGDVISVFDRSGALSQIQVHATEELTLSANGRTLTAEPINYNLFVDYAATGEIEHVYLAGLILRLPLPDGTTFLSAGQVEAPEGANFVITPDAGLSGDAGALCAALS